MESVIKVKNLTKDYGQGRGVFDISFEVFKGEVFGFLGPNGAGKTTTIRHLLGFSKPQSGSTEIAGLDCWKQPSLVQEKLGYLAGEIAYPENLTGWKFIKQIAEMRKVDLKKAEELCDYFQLKPHGELKRMSKGMKQKIALVIAFMHDAEIIILDEPTSGLDPLMQSRFCNLISKEKARGKTILMSSHMFEEVEKTCDRVAIIKQGKIIAEVKMKDIEHKKDKEYEVRFKDKKDAEAFSKLDYKFTEKNMSKNRVKVVVNDEQINEFLTEANKYKLEYLSEIKFTLEKYFMKYYQGEDNKNETAV
ncbi:MAG: ABC transporter ATP-binding protein [Christensenellaceae bacterium]|jgi:ABC-2 type transport system ATP-binding protein|nr:ABC transporter ATP-binding protein [Christensenellaceae bacterium]